MYVVLDSNVWISQRGMKSTQAIEALEIMQRRGATLVVPDVVRREVAMKLRDALLTHKKKIGDSALYISTILKGIENIVLPTCDEIEQCVQNLFDETGIPVRSIQLSLEAAESSLDKILRKLQPSDRAEQFTDGVIWANCLHLLEESDVYLVSKDKAFYRNYEYGDGLAPALLDEARHYSNSLHLCSGLDRLLQLEQREVKRVWPEDESAPSQPKNGSQQSGGLSPR